MLKLNLAHKTMILVVVPLALNLIILITLGIVLQCEKIEKQKDSVASEVNTLACQNIADMAASSSALYTYALTRQKSTGERYHYLQQEIINNDDRLLVLEGDHPDLLNTLKQLENLHKRGIKAGDAIAAAVDRGLDGETLLHQHELMQESHFIMILLLTEGHKLADRQNQTQMSESAEYLMECLKWLIVAGVIANLILSVAMAQFFARSFARRISVLMDSTLRVASGKALGQPMDGHDELALLDAVYHEMAEAVAEAQRKERQFTDNAIDVVCTIDEKRKFTAVNPAAERIWGYPPADLLGRTIDSITLSDDASRTLQRTGGSSEDAQINFENRIRHNNGSYVDMLWTALWSQSEKTYFCVSHDITKRKAAENLLKQSEARILTIIENLPVGLLTLDQAGKIETINRKTAEALAGSHDTLVARPLSDLLSIDEHGATGTSFELMLEKCWRKSAEFFCQRTDGSRIPIELSIDGFDFHGGRENYLAIMLDVSERHQLENARIELVRMVSHDLRTPLTSIEAILDLLSGSALGRLDSAEQEAAVRSQRELSRLLALINGLLDLEKIQAGSLELEREVNSGSEIAQKAAKAVTDIARQSEIELEVQAKDCELFCDADRIVQMIVLILIDALKEPDCSALRISAEEVERNQVTRFQIDVHRGSKRSGTSSDTDSETPFDPSNRGLALAISKGIVEAHRGSVQVLSGDANTTYRFDIPLPDQDYD